MNETETRRCIKCGREVAPDVSICELCNRAGMATPSTTQYHGTVVAAILLAVAGLAIWASVSLRGVGPYEAVIRDVVDAQPFGYEVTFAVTNAGTSPGRAKCQVVALGSGGQRLRARNTITEQIAGGASVETSATLPDLDAAPDEVTVECS